MALYGVLIAFRPQAVELIFKPLLEASVGPINFDKTCEAYDVGTRTPAPPIGGALVFTFEPGSRGMCVVLLPFWRDESLFSCVMDRAR